VIFTAALISSPDPANRRLTTSESYFSGLGNRERVGVQGGWYYLP
jgi:hypothetical protein